MQRVVRLFSLMIPLTVLAAAGCRQSPPPDATATPTPAGVGQSTVQDELDTRAQELKRREADLAAREAAVAQRERELIAQRGSAPAAGRRSPTGGDGATRGTNGSTERRSTNGGSNGADYGETRAGMQGVAVVVPAGTQFDVEFLDGLSSRDNVPGDQFRARVVQDIVADGRLAIPAGTRVLGSVTEAVPLKQVGGRARLGLAFERLELASGETPAIEASFAAEGRNETARDAATIGGAAAGGAVLGRVLNKRHKSRGTVIGAILGGAVGTVIASRTEGEEVRIDSGSVVGLKLDDGVRVTARR